MAQRIKSASSSNFGDKCTFRLSRNNLMELINEYFEYRRTLQPNCRFTVTRHMTALICSWLRLTSFDQTAIDFDWLRLTTLDCDWFEVEKFVCFSDNYFVKWAQVESVQTLFNQSQPKPTQTKQWPNVYSTYEKKWRAFKTTKSLTTGNLVYW